MNAAILVLAFAVQDKVTLGAAPSEGDTIKVQISARIRDVDKEKTVLEIDHTCTLSIAVKKKDGALAGEVKFNAFTLKMTGGEKPVDIAWDEAKKLDDPGWKDVPVFREVVRTGFSIAIDGAGNASGCSFSNAKHLIFCLEPLYAGSGTCLPGAAKAPGESWEKTVSSDEAVITYAGKYDKNEDGAAVVSTSITLKDGIGGKGPDGKGTSVTRVDLKTGRPLSATVSAEMPAEKSTLKFEATTRVVK